MHKEIILTPDLLMSQLVCYGEGQRQTRVLVDAAAAMWLTHTRHMREPQRLTGLVGGSANVFPVPKKVLLMLILSTGSFPGAPLTSGHISFPEH